MAEYIVRVELHGEEDYTHLYHSLKHKLGCDKSINDKGIDYILPHATYYCLSNIEDVIKAQQYFITEINKFYRDFEIILIHHNKYAIYGLEKSNRNENLLWWDMV
ncbi:MAG TPA: hypothetical protein PK431_01090 [Chitinophagales bacterium]|nr:hypothetical protein [Chitinophagales bacterium]